MKRAQPDDQNVWEGSGNVFADLGLENPEDEVLRAHLLWDLREEIERGGMVKLGPHPETPWTRGGWSAK